MRLVCSWLVAVLMVPAPRDPADAVRKKLAGEVAADAASAAKEGLWEEARADFELALAFDDACEAARKGLDKLDGERFLNWSDAMHKKYVAWKAKREKSGRERAKKLAEHLKDGEEIARLVLRLDPGHKEARALLGDGVKDEHFKVTCDAGEAEGRATLAWCEDTLRAFKREFHGLVEFKSPRGGMEVHHFKDRAGLDAHNRTAHGDRAGLKQAPGFFSTEDEMGHFCPVPAGVKNTLDEIIRHETTHQIAFYAMPAKDDPTKRPHFWAWEGLACYFETMQRRDGKLLLGRADHFRIRDGRDEVVKGTFTPWKEFVQATQAGVKGKYAQAATMAHFFMNAKRGAYREKFVEYARIIHEGAAEVDTFEKVFGAKPEHLQVEWVDYVKNLK